MRKKGDINYFQFDMKIVFIGALIMAGIVTLYYYPIGDYITQNVTIIDKGSVNNLGKQNYIETDYGRFWVNNPEMFDEIVLHQIIQIRYDSKRNLKEIIRGNENESN